MTAAAPTRACASITATTWAAALGLGALLTACAAIVAYAAVSAL